MLQPTDRVVAKTLIQIIGVFGASVGLPVMEVVSLLTASELQVVGDNKDLSRAIRDIREEVIAENKAELEGMASSLSKPRTNVEPEEENYQDAWYN